MDFPYDVFSEDRIRYLVSLGLHADEAAWVVSYLADQGCAFDQWGVDPKVTRLVNSLHARCWATDSGADSFIVSAFGGRQGCKLGAIIFNAAYSLALKVLHARLRAAGIVFRVQCEAGAFWQSSSSETRFQWHCPDGGGIDGFVDTLDATFVDDEAIILVASAPKVLHDSIQILLNI